MAKLMIVIEGGLLQEVVCDGPLPEGLEIWKADYDDDNREEPCLGGNITEDAYVNPARVAEVIEDLKKDSDNAVPDCICGGKCGATTNDPEADNWLPCSGCGEAFCPKCGEAHKLTPCYAEGN